MSQFTPQLAQQYPPQPPQGYLPQPAPWPQSPPTRPGWATAIGVVSTIWASLAIVCTPVNLVMVRFNPVSRKLMSAFPDWFRHWSTAASLVAVLLGFILLVAGIMLLMRRRAAGTLHLIWAAVALVLALTGFALNMAAFSQMEMPDGSPGERAGFIGGAIGGVIGGLVGMGYPVFLLIWFSRAVTRRQMNSWV